MDLEGMDQGIALRTRVSPVIRAACSRARQQAVDFRACSTVAAKIITWRSRAYSQHLIRIWGDPLLAFELAVELGLAGTGRSPAAPAS